MESTNIKIAAATALILKRNFRNVVEVSNYIKDIYPDLGNNDILEIIHTLEVKGKIILEHSWASISSNSIFVKDPTRILKLVQTPPTL